MELLYLKCFVTVAERQNFTEMAHSAIDRDDELEAPLIEPERFGTRNITEARPKHRSWFVVDPKR